MSDDFDHRAEKDAEMLADYYDELSTEAIQSNCDHDDIQVEEFRARLRLPRDMKKGDWIESNIFDVEAYFVCLKCRLGKWFPVNIEEYVMELDYVYPDDLY